MITSVPFSALIAPKGIRRRRASLMLPQNTDDLLFREPSLLHPPSPFEDGLYPKLEEFQGFRSLTVSSQNAKNARFIGRFEHR